MILSCNYFAVFIFLYFGLIKCDFGCSGGPNPNSVWTAPPTLVKSVTNGKLFVVGNSTSLTSTYVVHVFGTPYEMGYAQGQLVGSEIKHFFNEVVVWVEQQIENEYPYLPAFLVKIIVEFGVEAALEATYAMTESYIPEYYFEEMKGIADASGLDYMDVVRINLIPELVKAHCSMVGAWGKAVEGNNNTLYQLRALDWAVNGPFQKYASLVVYHPSAKNANTFANYGFLGLIGTLSGISAEPLGVCEKVWLKYNGTENTFGIPWHFVLRDILQWDKTVDQAVSRIQSATRTCSIFVGVGGVTEKFRAIEYSYDVVNVFDDQDFPAYENHPRMNGVVFLNKHTQPSTDPCLWKLLETSYGTILPKTLMQITSIHQTGNTHAAVYDFANKMLYVVAASPFVNGKCIPAYDRQWTQLSLDALWAIKSN